MHYTIPATGWTSVLLIPGVIYDSIDSGTQDWHYSATHWSTIPHWCSLNGPLLYSVNKKLMLLGKPSIKKAKVGEWSKPH